MTDDWDWIDDTDSAGDKDVPGWFAHVLALALGRADVPALLTELSCSTYDQWWRHYRINPWGYAINEFQQARLCSVVANSAWRPSKPRKPSDYLLKLE
jgi:hypothetical protein